MRLAYPFFTILASLVGYWVTPSVSTAEATEGSCSVVGQSMSISIPTVTLHNGVEMPILQLGACQLITVAGVKPELPKTFRGMLPERMYRQIELALTHGVRAFDTALIYRSQRPLGAVLGEWLRTGKLPRRQDVWITSKVFHPDATAITFGISHMPDLHTLTPDEVTVRTKEHFEMSLYELGVGYVDLMLLHWPSGQGLGTAEQNQQRRMAAWRVLEDMYQRGWARSIGVSNFAPKHIEQLLEDGATILPMVNQVEASVTLQYPDILGYCKEHGIVAQAYSPMGRGIKDLPPLVSEIAAKHRKDVGQVAFRYLIQLGYAITYLTNTESRMVTNTQIFDFELSEDEMKQLNALNRPDGGWGLPSPNDLD